MSKALDALVELLELKPLGDDQFEGRSRDYGQGNLYGGHVLAQALKAAYQTVGEDRLCHSLHSYFIRPGDFTKPVTYVVDRLRDGRSLSTRQVNAYQEGKSIFCMNTSFAVDEPGYEHQKPMPRVGKPTRYISEVERARRFKFLIPKKYREIATEDKPITNRDIKPINPLRPQKRKPIRNRWCKANGQTNPQDQALQQCLLAYASDMGFISTAMMPHGVHYISPKIQAASIDHSIWFHHPVDMNDWHLFHMTSPVASKGKGLNFAHFYHKDGQLVASCTQEGLMRVKPKPKAESGA